MTRPKDCDGLAWCDEAGHPTIDVSPDLRDKTMLWVFLHELAHIRHHSFIPLPEQVMSDAPEDTSPSYMRREDEADHQANVWLEYGKRFRDHNLPEFQGILDALLTYYQ